MTRMNWLIVPAVIIALIAGGVIGAAVVNHDGDGGERVVQITAPPSEPGQAPQVVTIDDDGRWRGGGFFPFGFIFPLLWIGLIVFLISAFWRRSGWGGGGGHWESRFEEWHKRQHQPDSQGPTPPSAASA